MSRSSFLWLRRIAVGAAALLVIGFAVGSLAKPGSKTGHAGSAGVTTYDAGSSKGLPAAAPQAAGGGGRTEVTTNSLGALALPGVSDSVIKTGDLRIQVPERGIDRAWTLVFQIAAKYGGFVLSSSQGNGPVPQPGVVRSDVSGPGADGVADIVLRIPAARFDQALVDLTNGDLGKVTRRGVSGQDVSQEFVDLNARLRNYRAQEAVLLRMMSKATSIGDTIAVQQQLSGVQEQIEQITGRLRYLKDQTALATISVHLAEPGAAVGGTSEGPSFSQAWETALDGLKRMGTAAMIAALWLSPFALLGALWLASRRWRARPPIVPAAPQGAPQA